MTVDLKKRVESHSISEEEGPNAIQIETEIGFKHWLLHCTTYTKEKTTLSGSERNSLNRRYGLNMRISEKYKEAMFLGR